MIINDGVIKRVDLKNDLLELERGYFYFFL